MIPEIVANVLENPKTIPAYCGAMSDGFVRKPAPHWKPHIDTQAVVRATASNTLVQSKKLIIMANTLGTIIPGKSNIPITNTKISSTRNYRSLKITKLGDCTQTLVNITFLSHRLQGLWPLNFRQYFPHMLYKNLCLSQQGRPYTVPAMFNAGLPLRH